MTSSACLQCRKHKIKVDFPCGKTGANVWTNEAYSWHKQCFGERPVCAHCVRKGTNCEYDIEEGLTRQQDLRTRLSSAQKELAHMEDLVRELRHGSDAYAIQLLVRLRMGEDVAQLVDVGRRHSIRYVFSTKSTSSQI